jgi:hypothetical protein
VVGLESERVRLAHRWECADRRCGSVAERACAESRELRDGCAMSGSPRHRAWSGSAQASSLLLARPRSAPGQGRRRRSGPARGKYDRTVAHGMLRSRPARLLRIAISGRPRDCMSTQAALYSVQVPGDPTPPLWSAPETT